MEEVGKKPPKVVKYLAGVTGSAAILISIIAVPFASPALRKICLPYVPATNEQVINVLQALKGRSGTLVDLGSGDGRIVMAASQKGFHSTGVELNPFLVSYSKIMSWTKGFHHSTNFICRDLWKVKLSPFRNVVIFGVEEMMHDLEKKLEIELDKNACVIACRFPLPSWTSITIIGEGINKVWLYKVPSQL